MALLMGVKEQQFMEWNISLFQAGLRVCALFLGQDMDPDLHQGEKSDPDPHQCDADTQHCGQPWHSGGQISTKHQKTSIKPFFATCRLPQYPEFAKNLRSFDGFDQMSRLWSMFRFRSFRIFCEKIAIFRTFDHWSEILSMSAGRPLGQGVCPPLLQDEEFENT